ncbi:Gibberellin 2-beta-dioxygenase 2 [Capsicum chinense]|nr:Gibberellin 2-beta-dioxygenase 2 [Capsicum chinense]
MDLHSDSLFRINHYPPFTNWTPHLLGQDSDTSPTTISKIGFGEHTDPQILTILRSNDAPGLQISPQRGLWVPVSPHPNTAFSVFVGDTLQIKSRSGAPPRRMGRMSLSRGLLAQSCTPLTFSKSLDPPFEVAVNGRRRDGEEEEAAEMMALPEAGDTKAAMVDCRSGVGVDGGGIGKSIDSPVMEKGGGKNGAAGGVAGGSFGGFGRRLEERRH